MNKYNSNVKYFTARNMLWDSAASPIILHALHAPNDLVMVDNDSVMQFFRANWPFGRSWKFEGNINIKRLGLYGNFSDGLVLPNNSNRLIMTIRASLFEIEQVTGTVVFTQGSNLVTGTNLDDAFAAGSGWKGFIVDYTTVGYGYPYSIYDVSPTTARLSDYAYRTVTTPKIYKMNYGLYVNGIFQPGLFNDYSFNIIPVLNTMFDAEIFFNAGMRSGDSKTPLLLGFINILPSGENFNFYTRSIDSSFNNLPVSFDGIVDVEVTPA